MTIPLRGAIFQRISLIDAKQAHLAQNIMSESLQNPNNPLKAKLERAERELTILYEVSNAMRTTLDLNHILYIILTSVTAHTGLGFNRAILYLINQQTRALEPKMAIGPESGEHAQEVWQFITESNQRLEDLIDPNKISSSTIHSSLFQAIKDLIISLEPEADNLLANAYHLGIPVHIQQNEIAQFENDPFLNKFKTTELLIMPLKAKDKVKGLLIVDNLYTQKKITDTDLKIFTMLANQAGLAIENSQLYEMVRHKSDTDSLTGLWNHGFFQFQLAKELKLAKKEHLPLSLLIMDIDNFKKLNDTQGHQKGDEILKVIADIVKDSSRDIDYVCRYGGEEFSMILTQTSKDQALNIAERIRQRINEYIFHSAKDGEAMKMSISIGLAAFPDNAKNQQELISQADKAMYSAKFGGKNQTFSA